MVRACHEAERAVGGARRRLRALGRRAAGRGRRPDRALAAAAHPRGGPRRTSACVVEPGVTNIAVSQAVGAHALLPARPVEPDRLHDRRQRGRELRRRALLQVRLHHQLRDRARAGAARRRRVVTLGGKELDHPGYDLLGAFVGSEGTLGIATKIWLRVVPEARGGAHARGVLRLDRRRPARWCREIVSEGIVPGRDRDDGQPLDPRRRGRHRTPAIPMDAGAALVVELDGSEAECETRFEQVDRDVRAAAPTAIRVAKDEAERELIWRARKAAFAAMGRIAPNYYVQDSVIPRTRLAEVLGRIDELARGARPPGGERLPRRRRQPAPARLLRRRAARARRSAPRSWPG